MNAIVDDTLDAIQQIAERILEDLAPLEEHNFDSVGEIVGVVTLRSDVDMNDRVALGGETISVETYTMFFDGVEHRVETFKRLVKRVRQEGKQIFAIWTSANAYAAPVSWEGRPSECPDSTDIRIVLVVAGDGTTVQLSETPKGIRTMTHAVVSEHEWAGNYLALILASINGTPIPRCFMCDRTIHLNPYGPVLTDKTTGVKTFCGVWKCDDLESCQRKIRGMSMTNSDRRTQDAFNALVAFSPSNMRGTVQEVLDNVMKMAV